MTDSLQGDLLQDTVMGGAAAPPALARMEGGPQPVWFVGRRAGDEGGAGLAMVSQSRMGRQVCLLCRWQPGTVGVSLSRTGL